MCLPKLVELVKLYFKTELENNSFHVKQGIITVIPRKSYDLTWYQISIEFRKPWGYRNIEGWKPVSRLSLFPPMTFLQVPEWWFDLETVIERFAKDWEYHYKDFWKRYNGKPKIIEPPAIKAEGQNNIVIEVVNLNSMWSESSQEWGHNAELGCWINDKYIPAYFGDKVIAKFVTKEGMLSVGSRMLWEDHAVFHPETLTVNIGEM